MEIRCSELLKLQEIEPKSSERDFNTIFQRILFG